MNRLLNFVIVVVVVVTLGSAFYFGTRGHQHKVPDQPPAELLKPADPPPPPAEALKEFKMAPILPGIAVDSPGGYRVDVIQVLGHHFLVAYRTAQLSPTAPLTIVEFSGNGETHISQQPAAPAPTIPPKKADGGDGGNFAEPPKEASP